MNRKLLICGAFAFDTMATGGQPVKTRELYYLLKSKYGEESIDILEITAWKSNPFKLLFDFFNKARRAYLIIMLPAHNGVLIFSRLLLVCKTLWKSKIYYDVIGGWLASRVENKKWLANALKKFDGIWVETSSMKSDLEKMGFDNVNVFKNFKQLLPVSNISYSNSEPLKLCTFSRVMREKGITDAVNAVMEINKRFDRQVYSLDIYGPVDDSYKDEFEQLIKSYPECISYNGIAQPQDSVKILPAYFALIFPTLFYTEGIPGTIIDAYFAGVPVISAKWLNSADVIEDGKTGFLFEFGNYIDFVEKLEKIAESPAVLTSLKQNCIAKSTEYTATSAIKRFIELTEI